MADLTPIPLPTPLQCHQITSVQSQWPCGATGLTPPRHYQIIIDGSRQAVPDCLQCKDGDMLLIVSKEDWESVGKHGLMIYLPYA